MDEPDQPKRKAARRKRASAGEGTASSEAGAPEISPASAASSGRAGPPFVEVASLRVWAEGKPPEWARLIAVRVALRVLPVVLSALGDDGEGDHQTAKLDLILQAFRASFISWVARKYPTHDMTGAARAAAFSANAALSASATAAYAYAANAAATAARAAAATAAARAANAAAYAAYTAAAYTAANGITAERQLWQSISDDARWLEGASKPEALIDQPLWLNEVRGDKKFKVNLPLWARTQLDNFARGRYGEGVWGLWVAWYRAILPNTGAGTATGAFGERADFAIATQSPEFWERAPESVMTNIAEIVGGSRQISLDLPRMASR